MGKMAFCCCLMLFCSSTSVWTKELTLNEVFSIAISDVESIKLQEIQTALAAENIKQEESRFYPKAAFVIDYTRLQDTNQYDGRLAVTMSSIQGLREHYRRKVAMLDMKAAEELQENVRRLLYVAISSAYYKLLGERAEVQNIDLQLKAATEREREIRRLVNLGRAQASDLSQQKVQVSLVAASLVQAQGAAQAADHSLRVISGVAADVSFADDSSPLPSSLLPIDELLSEIDLRHDILSLNTEIDSARNFIEVAKADYWPSLDLKGNLHAFRSGTLSSSWWDVGLSLNIPLFEGFSTTTEVRRARLTLKRSKLLLQQAKRAAAKEMYQVYDEAAKIFASLPLLKTAYNQAEAFYASVRRDYQNRLVRNLDVTIALNQLYSVKRGYDQSVTAFKAAYQTLLATSGKVP